jgi:hypothetical protein
VSERWPGKIFPRNLTARADRVVAGNPVNSRPEAGVDNCFPGLEFDQRNLDERFFPGFSFYYHRRDGARASSVPPELAGDGPLYLWALKGRFFVQEPEPSVVALQGQGGMSVWRRVHDLLPGTVAIVVGPKPGFGALFMSWMRWELDNTYAAAQAGGTPQPVVQRDERGVLGFAAYAAQRARYLDDDGVIDPGAYQPGELTKTMCAPWIYDFRDCSCFFWSSNKPDLVNVEHDGELQPYVNFFRRDRTGPPQPDVDYSDKHENGRLVQRRDAELTVADLAQGAWQRLPVVLDDTESASASAPAERAPSEIARHMDVEDAVADLTYLATVEHALTVEYLYALYSLDAPPRGAPPAADETARHVAAAQRQILEIAVDEMRHLMWANTALSLLGQPPSIARAQRIGLRPRTTRSGFPVAERAPALDRPFVLRRLDAAALDEFIAIEAPSKKVGSGLDGMYVYVLEMLQLKRDTIPCARELIPLIKLIVDEGHRHWERLTNVKATLAGIPEARYLRALSDEPPGPRQARYLQTCDAYYAVLLQSVAFAMTLGREAQPQLIAAAIRLMHDLDEIARVVAGEGYLPRFTAPAADYGHAPRAAARERLHRAFDAHAAGDAGEALLAAAHRLRFARHAAEVDAIALRHAAGRTRTDAAPSP